MSQRNLTLRLDRELIKKAKILAAQQDTSISALLTRYLEEILKQEESYQIAERKAVALLDQGFSLGGAIPATREDWHER